MIHGNFEKIFMKFSLSNKRIFFNEFVCQLNFMTRLISKSQINIWISSLPNNGIKFIKQTIKLMVKVFVLN